MPTAHAVALLGLLVGCAGLDAARPEAPPPPPPRAGRPSPEERSSPEDPRDLGARATFASLLDAARRLDDRRDQDSSAGCLLRPPTDEPGASWRLEADLAVALRPLPGPPPDLDPIFGASSGPVNVLTRWSAHGPGNPDAPTLVAVTTSLPARDAPVVVWALTAQGVFVRSTGGPAPLEPRPVAALVPPTGAGALYVTAEAGTPLERLAEVLLAVPASLHGQVGLAVVLAPGTRLPAAPPAEDASSSAGLCPEGLPPLPADVPEGDVETAALLQSLGPLRQAVATCVSGARTLGPDAARMRVALRIGPTGSVLEACATRDEAGDPTLRACVMRAVRATAFPAPRPAGMVDVELPLSLTVESAQRQAPLCGGRR